MQEYHRNADDLLTKLRKIEGQVRGVQKMIQEEQYCVAILNQFRSIKSVLAKGELVLLEGHTRGCMVDAIRGVDGDAKIEELLHVIRAGMEG